MTDALDRLKAALADRSAAVARGSRRMKTDDHP